MKIIVWIASILLAVAFVAIGGMKVVTPADVLQQSANGVPVTLLKVAGTAEMLGALGLVLPAATRILPVLTPLAASGLVLTMIGATTTNIVIGAYAIVPMTVVLGIVSALVAWARFGRYAVQPRSRSAVVTTPTGA